MNTEQRLEQLRRERLDAKIYRRKNLIAWMWNIIIISLFVAAFIAVIIIPNLPVKKVNACEVIKIVTPQLIELELPQNADGEFKTYMDYRSITDSDSKQYQLQQIARTNSHGFRILNNKYLVAVGTYYAKQVGKVLQITLESGKVFQAIVGDIKENNHTDGNNQYVRQNGNILEFIVDTNRLDSTAKYMGDISVLGLEGKIIKIEEVQINE